MEEKLYKVIEYLVQEGLSVNASDSIGTTALHLAVKYNDINAVKLLLGANVNSSDNFGNIPIANGNPNTNLEIFRFLIKNGSDILKKNRYGVSAYELYSKYPQIKKVFDR